MFTVDGENWHQMRKYLTHEFSTKDLFMKSTLDSIMKVAFGVELGITCGTSEEGVMFSKAFDDVSDSTTLQYLDISWKVKSFLNIRSEATLEKNDKVIDDFVHI
ncbi:hypothetical protein ACFE04_008267 [Oxalis oulophora]